MLTNYSNFKQGDIVIVEMRFSNNEESKVRPALVISSDNYNANGGDIILLKVTSQSTERPFNVRLTQRDLTAGTLNFDSIVKADFPIVVTKERVLKTIGKVNPKIVQQAKEKLKQIFEL